VPEIHTRINSTINLGKEIIMGTKYSLGAMRAAGKIYRAPFVLTESGMADIIDKATHSPEMISALEQIITHWDMNDPMYAKSEAASKIRAILVKVKGE
jgi:hypothetical protein